MSDSVWFLNRQSVRAVLFLSWTQFNSKVTTTDSHGILDWENPADLRKWGSWTDSTQVEHCSCQPVPSMQSVEGSQARNYWLNLQPFQCEIQKQRPKVFHPEDYCLKSQSDPELESKNVEVNQRNSPIVLGYGRKAVNSKDHRAPHLCFSLPPDAIRSSLQISLPPIC